MVSVCLVHYDRPDNLSQAIKSLQEQSYPGPFEVVIVDDGSPSPDTQAALDRFEAELPGARWRILRKANGYLGAARNSAAALARGDYLLFMDDDNLAKSNMIETFVTAARTGGPTSSPV